MSFEKQKLLHCWGNASQKRQGLFKAFHHHSFFLPAGRGSSSFGGSEPQGGNRLTSCPCSCLTPGIPTGCAPWHRMESCHINNGLKWRRIAHCSPLRYLPRNCICSGTGITTAQLQRSPLLLAIAGDSQSELAHKPAPEHLKWECRGNCFLIAVFQLCRLRYFLLA